VAFIGGAVTWGSRGSCLEGATRRKGVGGGVGLDRRAAPQPTMARGGQAVPRRAAWVPWSFGQGPGALMYGPPRTMPGGSLNGSKKFKPIQKALNDFKPIKFN
jgi:hypothetical protein